MNQGGIHELDTNLIQPNPLQPRGSIAPNSLLDLAESIREHGILEPLVIAHTPAGYQIIAGERRWRAAKMVGLKSVPVVIKKVKPSEMLILAIVENLQREDLNVFEQAAGYKKLNEEFGLSHEDIGRMVGLARTEVTNTIRMLNLPDIVKDAVLTETINKSQAQALLHLRSNEIMVQVFTTKVLRENYSVRQIEELARRLEQEGKIQRGQGRPAIWKRSKKSQEIEERIQKELGCEIDLRRSTRQIRMVLTFAQEETLEKIYQRLIRPE